MTWCVPLPTSGRALPLGSGFSSKPLILPHSGAGSIPFASLLRPDHPGRLANTDRRGWANEDAFYRFSQILLLPPAPHLGGFVEV